MPRRPRAGSGGFIFHVLNRGVRRQRLFDAAADYTEFERLLDEARRRIPIRLLVFCLMPTHFHFVLWPENDDQLSRFMHWLTGAHARTWHARHETAGTGPVYQGRFKSFPIQDGGHFLRVCRYVERNARRAELCERAQDWRWSSLWHRCRNGDPFPLDDWPTAIPANWMEIVNREESDLSEIRRCVKRGRPYGDGAWSGRVADVLGLDSTLRERGRPRQKGDGILFSRL